MIKSIFWRFYMTDTKICVGLFGTCGNSTWRKDIIPSLLNQNIAFFNPQKDDWCDDDAVQEAKHLINDDVILFPVTDVTYGTGSLAETGYSIMQAIRSHKNRFVVLYIAPDVNPVLKTNDPVAAKESLRSRVLVREHLKNINNSNVFIVDSMQEMYEVGIKLAQAAQLLLDVRNRKSFDLNAMQFGL